MKIIEQAGFAQRRSLLTFDGSERNAAAWVAMNASRGFPPYSPCQCVSASKPVPVSRNRVLAGAECVKKLRPDTAPCGTGRSATSASITSRSAERSRRKAWMSGRPPPGTRTFSTRYQAAAPRSADKRSFVTADPGTATVLMRSTPTMGSPTMASRLRPDALAAMSEL